jgi:integrase
MPLTNLAIKTAKPRGKAYKLSDEKGLFLLVQPTGSLWWRLKYRFQGKEKLISLGTFPEISLAEARDQRDAAKRLLAKGVDPSEHRKTTKSILLAQAANTFESTAREWLSKRTEIWNPASEARNLRRLELHVFPRLGKYPVARLTARQFLDAVREVESNGTKDTARRTLNLCSQIMRYAVQTGRAERDPCVDLKGALVPVKVQHFAAVTEPGQVAPLIKKIRSYGGTHVVRTALQLAPLVFVRPNELRTARWQDIHFDIQEWRFTVTKTDTEHIVPLSAQSVALLRDIQAYTGDSDYIFPGARSRKRPMSENAILAALRALEIPKDEMTGHGFRAMARTILEEVLGFSPDLIEHQLAHTVRGPMGRTYNRTTHLPERKKMMQVWADWLDSL